MFRNRWMATYLYDPSPNSTACMPLGKQCWTWLLGLHSLWRFVAWQLSVWLALQFRELCRATVGVFPVRTCPRCFGVGYVQLSSVCMLGSVASGWRGLRSNRRISLGGQVPSRAASSG